MVFWKTKTFELYAPLALSGIALLALYIFKVSIQSQFGINGWTVEDVYNAVFNWSSIQSGFIFGIYGFIAAKKDGFVAEIARGNSYDRFLGFAQRAYLGGFALTFATLPLIVTSPDIKDASDFQYLTISIWFAAFIWAFAAFLRVAFIFGLIAAIPDNKKRLAG